MDYRATTPAQFPADRGGTFGRDAIDGRSPSRFADAACPYRKPRRRNRRAIVAVGAVALVAAAIGIGLTVRACTAGNLDVLPVAVRSGTLSTPVSEWRAGSMPLLLQTDPAWADEPYAGATVGESGCGPTCLTMVYVYLTGNKDRDPASMCLFSEENGFVEDGLTAWRLMTDGAALLGLVGEELPADASSLANVLSSGLPVICSMAPGDFTKTGHFTVLCGLDDEGRARVFDPNSAERSAVTWDLDVILSQCRNLWAFSRA